MNNYVVVLRRQSQESDSQSFSSISSSAGSVDEEQLTDTFSIYSQPSLLSTSYKMASYVMAQRLHEEHYSLDMLDDFDFNILADPSIFEKAMFERVKACEHLHSNIYADTCSHIPLVNEHDVFRVVLEIADELFNYEEVTWRKVVSWFTFGANLALYCFNLHNPQLVPQLARWFSHYVDDVLSDWIEKQGGWDNFVEYQKSESEKQLTSNDVREALSVRRLLSVGLGAGMTLGAVTLGAVLAGRV